MLRANGSRHRHAIQLIVAKSQMGRSFPLLKYAASPLILRSLRDWADKADHSKNALQFGSSTALGPNILPR